MIDLQADLYEPAKTVLSDVRRFAIDVLLVVIILILGWILARVIKTLVTKALRAIRLDRLSDKIELDSLLAKGGIKYSLSELIGIVCYWVALLVTFVVAFNAIGLTVAAELLNRVVLYIPNIIAAIFIVILGMFVSTLLRNIVITAANNAGLSQANVLAKIVDIVVVIFTLAIALEQLNIGATIIQLTVTVILGSLGLALALAFGLGCKDLARDAAARFLQTLRERRRTDGRPDLEG